MLSPPDNLVISIGITLPLIVGAEMVSLTLPGSIIKGIRRGADLAVLICVDSVVFEELVGLVLDLDKSNGMRSTFL